MSLVIPPTMGHLPFTPFPDVQPFSLRSAASYEDIQWGIVAWIRDDLVPYLQASGAQDIWNSNADTLIDRVNEIIAGEETAFGNRLNEAFLGSFGSICAPAATGIADTDTTNIKASIALAQASLRDLFVPGGTISYKMRSDANLVWDASRGSLRGAGQVDLDFSLLASGYALEIIGSPSATAADRSSAPSGGNYYSGRPITHVVEGFRLQGPGNESTFADGVVVRQQQSTVKGVEPAQGLVRNLFIRGFRDGYIHAEGSFCVQSQSVFVQACFRRGLSLSTQGAAGGLGENISFTGCTFAGTKNSAGTGMNVYTDPAAIADANFFACSFDYGDIEIDHNAGDMTFSACHWENNSGHPMVQLSAGAGATTFTALGGSWRASGSNPAPRDHIIEVKSGSTGDVVVSVIGGGGGPGQLDTRFFKNLSATLPAVVIRNFNWIGGRHMGVAWTTYGNDLNLLINGQFETSQTFTATNIGGWKSGTLAGVTHAINNSHPKSGTYCLNVTGTGTTGTDYTSQLVAITPGGTIAASCNIAIWDYIAGSMQVMVNFYAADRTTLLDTYRVTSSLSATVNPYQTAIAKMPPPKGAAYAEFSVQATNWNGYFTIDNAELVQV